MQSTNEFDFDAQGLEPIEFPVKYKGKKYILTEVSEDGAVKFKDKGLACAKFTIGDEGKPKAAVMEGMADNEPLLVSECLYAAEDDGSEHGKLRIDAFGNPDKRYRIPVNTIRDWKYSVVHPLFLKAKEISKLGEQPETKDELTKQIDILQKRLDKLLDKERTLDEARNKATEEGVEFNDEENLDPNSTEAMRDRS